MTSGGDFSMYTGGEANKTSIIKHFFQPTSSAQADDEYNSLRISISIRDCLEMRDARCISGLHMQIGGNHVHIVNGVDGGVWLNEEKQTLPCSKHNIYMKQATSKFIHIMGYGFTIRYDNAQALYINLKPAVFENKVLTIRFMFIY